MNEQIGEKTNFVVGLKRPKINKEEAGDGYLKTILNFSAAAAK